MEHILLPQIEYNKFSNTRDSIQLIAQLVSAIKGKIIPHQKNWEEYSLKVYSKGFTSSAIPMQTQSGIEALELNINLIEHKLKIFYKNFRDEISLEQSTILDFTNIFVEKLNSYGIEIAKQDAKFYANKNLTYDKSESEKLWNLFRQVYFLFLKFRGTTLFEASNINLWPHHFDLALLLFSGKLVDGQEPSNWDYSREQMNFGLSSGDSGIQQPYFYVTAYPFDEKILKMELPKYAKWHTQDWQGLVIKINQLENQNEIMQKLNSLFTTLLNANYS